MLVDCAEHSWNVFLTVDKWKWAWEGLMSWVNRWSVIGDEKNEVWAVKLKVISKCVPRSLTSLSSQFRSSLTEDLCSLCVSLWYGNEHIDPGWRTCRPREPTALGGSLRLKVGEQNSSGLCFHFLPPHFCLKFCFSSGVLFRISHSFQCLGKSPSIFKSKINEATVQACPAPKNTWRGEGKMYES